MMLFFGCLKGMGLYWHACYEADGVVIPSPHKGKPLPKRKPVFMGAPAPGLPFPDGDEGFAAYLPGVSTRHGRVVRSEVCGAWKLTHRRGWTILAWWDRKGPDKRGGVHSSLWLEGTWNAETMVDLGVACWPALVDRVPDLGVEHA